MNGSSLVQTTKIMMMEPDQLILEPGRLKALFDANASRLGMGGNGRQQELRAEAMENFLRLGYPTRKLEAWKFTDLQPTLDVPYDYDLDPAGEKVDLNRIFQCEIHNFETYLFSQLNGWYVWEHSPMSELPEGAFVGSLREAKKRFPEVFDAHYGRYADITSGALEALNTAFALDGIFIYVPDNVVVEKPVQMVNIVNYPQNIFIQPRNLIVLGKNAKLTLVHCDDSIQHKFNFTNAVSEFAIGENGELDYYKLQNKDDDCTLVNNNYFHLSNYSRLTSNTLTFNGGLIRNESKVKINGSGAEANLFGLYLMDGKQHVDNRVFVDHAKPGSYSNELYKGIIDEHASAAFYGHILVRRDAQKTNAYQNNRNITLTDTARVDTNPFLEIYADDVKCSHGATVGQLDQDALFYLRTRGICERNSKMLLMYAFAAEIAGKINIPALRERTEQMIEKRLKGELTICDQCVLHCKDEPIEFTIDMNLI
jgi:Fe-S cluster assembly protein SufD